MKFLSLLTTASLFTSAAAFSTAPAFTTSVACHRIPALFVAPETFFRAVECADGSRFCDIEELDKLATELEEYVGCDFEKEPEDCDKEIQDRIDVAEILRMQIELKLRTDYLKNANLFASDVRKEHDIEERKKFKENLKKMQRKEQAGADLGLW